MNPAIFLSPWFWLALALAGAGIAGKYAVSEHDALIAYKSSVEAVAKAQEVKNKETEIANQKRKEEADAQNAALQRTNTALAASLRDARTRTRFVSAAPTAAGSPQAACYNRDDLERATQLLDAGLSAIALKGDKAITDLNTARAWAR